MSHRRLRERRSDEEHSCGWILVVLLALVLGEIIWVLLFTGIAVWLRRGP